MGKLWVGSKILRSLWYAGSNSSTDIDVLNEIEVSK